MENKEDEVIRFKKLLEGTTEKEVSQQVRTIKDSWEGVGGHSASKDRYIRNYLMSARYELDSAIKSMRNQKAALNGLLDALNKHAELEQGK